MAFFIKHQTGLLSNVGLPSQFIIPEKKKGIGIDGMLMPPSSLSISLFLSAFAGSFEVTVTPVSLPPFESRRGLSNTTQRLSLPTLSTSHRGIFSKAHPFLC